MQCSSTGSPHSVVKPSAKEGWLREICEYEFHEIYLSFAFSCKTPIEFDIEYTGRGWRIKRSGIRIFISRCYYTQSILKPNLTFIVSIRLYQRFINAVLLIRLSYIKCLFCIVWTFEIMASHQHRESRISKLRAKGVLFFLSWLSFFTFCRTF